MARLFDELNILSKNRAIPYEQYFGEMVLSKEQEKERIDTAKEFEDMMLFIFSLIAVINEYQYTNISFVIGQLKNRYQEIVALHTAIDEYLENYIEDFSEQTIQTTQDNGSDEWYLSDDRAMFIAENEANTVLNHSDFMKAVKSGKKQKKWITMRDKKVRTTHKELDSKTIKITDVFLVGNSEMFYPKDTTFGASAEEIVNCRCSIKYF